MGRRLRVQVSQSHASRSSSAMQCNGPHMYAKLWVRTRSLPAHQCQGGSRGRSPGLVRATQEERRQRLCVQPAPPAMATRRLTQSIPSEACLSGHRTEHWQQASAPANASWTARHEVAGRTETDPQAGPQTSMASFVGN